MANQSLPDSISIDNLVFAPLPTHRRFQDVTGQRFNRMTVLGLAGKEEGKWVWFCQCSCGQVKKAKIGALKNGQVQSCGCLNRELLAAARSRRLIHGQIDSQVYRVWANMKSRCYNPRSSKYKYYGGRGIRVCKRWHIFTNFYTDMGDPPGDQYSIDRVNSDGDYDPSNCRWATREVQNGNRRGCILFTYNGLTLNLAAWCRRLGLSDGKVRARMRQGRSIAEALELV